MLVLAAALGNKVVRHDGTKDEASDAQRLRGRTVTRRRRVIKHVSNAQEREAEWVCSHGHCCNAVRPLDEAPSLTH